MALPDGDRKPNRHYTTADRKEPLYGYDVDGREVLPAKDRSRRVPDERGHLAADRWYDVDEREARDRSHRVPAKPSRRPTTDRYDVDGRDKDQSYRVPSHRPAADRRYDLDGRDGRYEREAVGDRSHRVLAKPSHHPTDPQKIPSNVMSKESVGDIKEWEKVIEGDILLSGDSGGYKDGIIIIEKPESKMRPWPISIISKEKSVFRFIPITTVKTETTVPMKRLIDGFKNKFAETGTIGEINLQGPVECGGNIDLEKLRSQRSKIKSPRY